MFKTFKTMAKNSVKPHLGIKDQLIEAKETHNKTAPPQQLVSPETTKEEFVQRYENARILAIVIAFFILVTSVITVFAARDIPGIIVCIISFIILSIGYLKISFKLWCARNVFYNWDARLEPKVILMKDYIDDIKFKPTKILPIKITINDT